MSEFVPFGDFDPAIGAELARAKGRHPDRARPEAKPTKERKRRKDATGQKSDYHKGSSTLSVRLPDAQADQVRAAAEAEGIAVNAWLQAAIMAHLGR